MSGSPEVLCKWRRAALALATAIVVSACGSGSSSSASTARQPPSQAAAVRSGHVRVSISGFAYDPVTLVVTPGTRVTFANHDQTAHTATSTGPGFDSGTIAPGASRSVTLGRPGTYAFVCQFHPFMRGTVIVRRR